LEAQIKVIKDAIAKLEKKVEAIKVMYPKERDEINDHLEQAWMLLEKYRSSHT